MSKLFLQDYIQLAQPEYPESKLQKSQKICFGSITQDSILGNLQLSGFFKKQKATQANNFHKIVEDSKQQNTPQNFKTKLCRHFQVGNCKLGGLCNFAHGEQELLQSQQKEKYLESHEKVKKIENFQAENANYKIQKLKKKCKDIFTLHCKSLQRLEKLMENLNEKNELIDQVNNIEEELVLIYNTSIEYTESIKNILQLPVKEKKKVENSFDVLYESEQSTMCSFNLQKIKSNDNKEECIVEYEKEKNGIEQAIKQEKLVYILNEMRKIYKQKYEKEMMKMEIYLGQNSLSQAEQTIQDLLCENKLDENLYLTYQTIVKKMNKIDFSKYCRC